MYYLNLAINISMVPLSKAGIVSQFDYMFFFFFPFFSSLLFKVDSKKKTYNEGGVILKLSITDSRTSESRDCIQNCCNFTAIFPPLSYITSSNYCFTTSKKKRFLFMRPISLWPYLEKGLFFSTIGILFVYLTSRSVQ